MKLNYEHQKINGKDKILNEKINELEQLFKRERIYLILSHGHKTYVIANNQKDAIDLFKKTYPCIYVDSIELLTDKALSCHPST